MGTKTPQNCHQKCVKTSDCKYWSVDDDHGCWLKRSDSGRGIHRGAVSGPVAPCSPCWEADVNYYKYGRNYDLPDNVQPRKNIFTAPECEKRCQNTNGCNYWSVDVSYGCWLKFAKPPGDMSEYKQLGVTSGPAKCGTNSRICVELKNRKADFCTWSNDDLT